LEKKNNAEIDDLLNSKICLGDNKIKEVIEVTKITKNKIGNILRILFS